MISPELRDREQVARLVRMELAGSPVKTPTELARRLGVSQTTVWRRLSGEVDFTVIELVKIARVLGVPAWRLLPRDLRGDGSASIPWKTRPTAKRGPAVVRTIVPPTQETLTGRVARPNGRPAPSKADRLAEAGPRRLYRVGQ